MKPIPAIILAPLIVHPIWGLLMLVSPTPIHTVGIDAIYRVTTNPTVATCLVAFASTTAIMSHKRAWHGNWRGFLAMMPQQFLMLLAAYTIVVCLVEGRYADGYVPQNGWRFIASDQVFLLICCILHTLQVCKTYLWKTP